MTVYDFEIRKPDNTEITLEEYKGKVLVIVNTASKCGYTKQLMGLERIYNDYKDQGLVVLAFPANQFENQEPDPIDDIIETYTEEYGVTFPIFNKLIVNGPSQNKLFGYLKEQIGFDPESETPDVMIPYYEKYNKDWKESPDIKWNFTKFLVDRKGKVRYRFEPEQTPSHMDEKIKELLAEEA